MATILLGWELGGGLGHVQSLAAVARALAAQGHRPVLAVKDLLLARNQWKDNPFPLLQAPLHSRSGPGVAGFRAASFADILAYRGFAEPDGLAVYVGAWQALLELTGARLVVADYSPTLCLAAYGSVPVVVLGNGFTVPPAEGTTFPPLDPNAQPTLPAEQVLATVQDVQRRRGRPVPATLPTLFAGAARFIRTLPEFDPYRAVRREPLAGPLQPLPPPSPPPARPEFFAYLSAAYAGVDLLLPALTAAGWTGSAFLRGASRPLIAALRRAGCAVHETPPPLAEAVARATVILHHSGPGTAAIALAVGRPQVLFAEHLEHELTANALEALGVARAVTGRVSVEMAVAAVNQVRHEPRFAQQAQAQSRALQARRWTPCLPTILNQCLDLLEATEPNRVRPARPTGEKESALAGVSG